MFSRESWGHLVISFIMIIAARNYDVVLAGTYWTSLERCICRRSLDPFRYPPTSELFVIAAQTMQTQSSSRTSKCLNLKTTIEHAPLINCSSLHLDPLSNSSLFLASLLLLRVFQHLLDDLLLLNQERSHDPVAHAVAAARAAVGA
jgi:hypothetical protein